MGNVTSVFMEVRVGLFIEMDIQIYLAVVNGHWAPKTEE